MTERIYIPLEGARTWNSVLVGIQEARCEVVFCSPNLTDTRNQYGHTMKEMQDREWDATHGLDWEDFGARMYDPVLCRWWSLDPLAAQLVSWSPYNSVFSDPMRFTDPTGMSPTWVPDGQGGWTAEAGDSAWSLHIDAGISFEEAKGLIAEMNVHRGQKNLFMVHPGDVVRTKAPNNTIGPPVEIVTDLNKLPAGFWTPNLEAEMAAEKFRREFQKEFAFYSELGELMEYTTYGSAMLPIIVRGAMALPGALQYIAFWSAAKTSTALTKNSVIEGFKVSNHAWRKSGLGRGATEELISDVITGARKAGTVITETGTGQFSGNVIKVYNHNGVKVAVDETRQLIMSIRPEKGFKLP